jgi:predicted nucleotidyltransferase
MGTHRSPAEVLFGSTRRALLSLFFRQPDNFFYVREIVRQAGLGQGTVQRELQRLLSAGIIERSVRGRQVFYRANPRSPVFPELRSFMIKTTGMADVLRARLATIADRIAVAFIHGSVAKRTLNERSDIDLVIVGRAGFGEVVAAIGDAAQDLGRELNPTVYPAEEFRKKIRTGHHFLSTVLSEEKIFLIGDEGELRRLAEE